MFAQILEADAVVVMNKAMRGLYKSGAWINKDEAAEIAMNGVKFLEIYGELAKIAFQRGLSKFPLTPKFHYLNHTWTGMLEEAKRSRWVLNPLCFANQLSEDFIGRPSRISRRVNPRSAAKRTVQRTFLAMRNCMEVMLKEGFGA